MIITPDTSLKIIKKTLTKGLKCHIKPEPSAKWHDCEIYITALGSIMAVADEWNKRVYQATKTGPGIVYKLWEIQTPPYKNQHLRKYRRYNPSMEPLDPKETLLGRLKAMFRNNTRRREVKRDSQE